MLTEPLTFTGTLSLRDALDLNHYLFRYIVDWPVRILMTVTSALIAAFLIFVVRLGNLTFTLCIILFLCAYFPFGWILHRRLAAWWYYRRHRDQVHRAHRCDYKRFDLQLEYPRRHAAELGRPESDHLDITRSSLYRATTLTMVLASAATVRGQRQERTDSGSRDRTQSAYRTNGLTKRWSERRTAARFTFEMTSTLPLRATPGLVCRRSAWSR